MEKKNPPRWRGATRRPGGRQRRCSTRRSSPARPLPCTHRSRSLVRRCSAPRAAHYAARRRGSAHRVSAPQQTAHMYAARLRAGAWRVRCPGGACPQAAMPVPHPCIARDARAHAPVMGRRGGSRGLEAGRAGRRGGRAGRGVARGGVFRRRGGGSRAVPRPRAPARSARGSRARPRCAAPARAPARARPRVLALAHGGPGARRVRALRMRFCALPGTSGGAAVSGLGGGSGAGQTSTASAAPLGAVSSTHYLATEAGFEALRAGARARVRGERGVAACQPLRAPALRTRLQRACGAPRVAMFAS